MVDKKDYSVNTIEMQELSGDNTIIHFSKQRLKQWAVAFFKGREFFRGPPSVFNRYREDVFRAGQMRFNPDSQEFLLTRKAITEFKKICDEKKLRPVLIIFTLRPLAYYEKITGKAPPSDHFEIAVTLHIKEFCRTLGVDVIDTHPTVLSYVNGLSSERARISELPYFEVDGHLNALGNRLVAQDVLSYLRKLQD